MNTRDADMRRLRWQCRRGLLELDLLLQGFLESRYAHLREADKALFCRLLETPDPVMLAWVQDRDQSPSEYRNIINIIVQ
jgi:antitoxin CptB